LADCRRGVAEALRRGRIYRPGDVLAESGVGRDLLIHCAHTRTREARVRKAIAALVEVNEGFYRQAEPGIEMLDPVASPCVTTAFRLYRAILDEIIAADFDVWSTRHRVSDVRKFTAAVPALARSLWLRTIPRPRAG